MAPCGLGTIAVLALLWAPQAHLNGKKFHNSLRNGSNLEPLTVDSDWAHLSQHKHNKLKARTLQQTAQQNGLQPRGGVQGITIVQWILRFCASMCREGWHTGYQINATFLKHFVVCATCDTAHELQRSRDHLAPLPTKPYAQGIP